MFNGRSHKVHVTATFLLSESYYTVQFHYKCQRFSLREKQLALNKMKSQVRMWKMSSKLLFKGTNRICQKNVAIQEMVKSILHSNNNNIRNKNIGVGNSGSIVFCLILIYAPLLMIGTFWQDVLFCFNHFHHLKVSNLIFQVTVGGR